MAYGMFGPEDYGKAYLVTISWMIHLTSHNTILYCIWSRKQYLFHRTRW
jgi:hypothetical protein